MAQPKSPVVMCPGCKVPMGVKLVVTGKAGEMTEVTYACVICQTETTRRYKMPEPPITPAKATRRNVT